MSVSAQSVSSQHLQPVGIQHQHAGDVADSFSFSLTYFCLLWVFQSSLTTRKELVGKLRTLEKLCFSLMFPTHWCDYYFYFVCLRFPVLKHFLFEQQVGLGDIGTLPFFEQPVAFNLTTIDRNQGRHFCASHFLHIQFLVEKQFKYED